MADRTSFRRRSSNPLDRIRLQVDNVTADAGSGGAVFATDDIGGVHYPITKITFGALDSQTIAASGAGAVSAGVQRFSLASDDPAVALLGTIDADTGGILADTANMDTNLGTVAGAVSGTEMQVDIVADATDVPNLVSTNNSTTTPINANITYTGTAEDVSAYSCVTIHVDSSHDSATDGMTFEFCEENTFTNPDTYAFTYTAADGPRRFQFPVTAQYFRVKYTNTGTNQTSFAVQTILHRNNVLTSIHRLVDDMDPDRSAQVVKSVLFAQAAGSGDFVPVDATAAGNLKVAIEENDAGNITVNQAQIAGTATSVGNGTTDTGTQRVTLSSDSTGVLSVDDNGGSLTVDGTVTANLSAIDNAVLDQIEVNTSYGDSVGGGTEAAALRVTVASDSTGVLSVDDNGGSLTVDNADITTIAGAVSGTEMQVDVVAALPAGDNNIGNVDIASSVALDVSAATVTVDLGANNDVTIDPAAVTSLGLIDNPIVAHDAAVSGSTGVNMIGAVAQSADPTAVASADATRILASLVGKQVVLNHALPGESWSYASAAAVTDTADDAAKTAAGAGIRNYITGVQVFNGHDTVGTEVVIKDGSTVLWRGWAEQTGGGCSAKFDPPLRGTANTAVNVANITTGSSTYFNLQGYEAAE